jgi:hypothetical protein
MCAAQRCYNSITIEWQHYYDLERDTIYREITLM